MLPLSTDLYLTFEPYMSYLYNGTNSLSSTHSDFSEVGQGVQVESYLVYTC